MELKNIVNKELGIPKHYININNLNKNRALIIVNCQWISSLLTTNTIPEFIYHNTLAGDEIQALFYEKVILQDWQKLLINVVTKPKENEYVIPLPRARILHSTKDTDLSFAQLLHCISETNFKNVWKHFYKKYTGSKLLNKTRENFKGNSTAKNNELLIEIINRFYGCKIIQENNFYAERYSLYDTQNGLEPHPNLLPALCAVETKNHFLIIHYIDHIVTLKDSITFSPTFISINYCKPLFIIYQLSQLMKNCHDKGLILGNLYLDDIFINDSLFVQVIPNLQEYICNFSSVDCVIPESIFNDQLYNFSSFPKHSPPSSNILLSLPLSFNLEVACKKWINRQISNFEYLMYLNHIAGRRFGDPTCHFIMPWVSDFATRTNGTWRDLSKSKFRLNKGDRQLDLTYENAVNSNQVSHHVSDVLSEITYYVYLSRRTPRSILCKYVRSVWVPAEYPSSIQRLQEWTPDECIPEFFYDPAIFKSIHEDLPDLELPHWALTPEEFIEAHRECLESKYVSERLHQWIDLTFGYKLSGSAAVKAKNVCLHLVENHRKLKTSGIVQLFSYPHPPRHTQGLFHEKVPPKILLSSLGRQSKISVSQSEKGTVGSEDEGQSSGNGEDDSFGAKSSPLIFSKFISRSKGSLLASFQSSSTEDGSRPEQSKSGSLLNQTSNSAVNIILPKEYNPSAFLLSMETNQNFFRKTFCTNASDTDSSDKAPQVGLKQIVAKKRIQEMQVLGCLIVEIFLLSKIRAMDLNDLDKRITACLKFLNHENLPRCVRSGVSLLLQPFKDLQNYPYITSPGLPPPSPHQILQPLLSSFIFPFPKLFSSIYSSFCCLVLCSRAIAKYHLENPVDHSVCNTLNVLKVKKLNIDLEKIWDELLSTKNDQIVQLVFPFLKELFDNPSTSRLSIILFLDKICRSLGPKQTNELLLETIVNLYNSEIYETSENLYLYHKNFLLILIVRCGLKVFLENFIGPLMETVGRYKDCFSEKWSAKQNSDEVDPESEEEIIFSNSSPDGDLSERNLKKQESEVEVFLFDQDDSSLIHDGNETEHGNAAQLCLNLPSDGDQGSQDEEVLESPGKTFSETSLSKNFVSSPKYNLEEKNVESKEELRKSKKLDYLSLENDLGDLSQVKASEVAGDSIIWLAHRLGPVLTSRFLIRNLLRVLSLCFTGKDNLEPHKFKESDESNLWKLSVLKWKVLGDENVETTLRILGEISELYGEQIILLQYLPFMSELINLSKKKFTLSLEGGIIGCLTLLKHIVPFMNDTTLMDQLQDVILKTIIHPVIRLVSSTKFVFPSGQRGRYTLVSKLIDCIYLISLRIGVEMTKVHITVPALQRFFLTFNKAHDISDTSDSQLPDKDSHIEDSDGHSRYVDESKYLEIKSDGSTTEWTVRGAPGETISIAHFWSTESLDSSPSDPLTDKQEKNKLQSKALTELKNVFDDQLAHQCYAAFYRFLGEAIIENSLKNNNFIRDLYYRYEQEQSLYSPTGSIPNQMTGKELLENQENSNFHVGSFGSNVAVIGNKIELQSQSIGDSLAGIIGVVDSDVTALICKEKEDSGRHLRGNWLAYWEHEIGRSEKDCKFNFKQIKLQTFTGHKNSVRMIHCLDNENSFMSGSKDKTVKLWSLRSQGDGSSTSNCQFTYSRHKKSLLSLSFIHSIRKVASCDSTIHLWDPFEGKTISVLDGPKMVPINVIRALNPPSCNLIAATTDATLKIVDTRVSSFVSEYRISINSIDLIRSICVSPSGNWIAVGQSSGLLTVLDSRTGMILSSCKGHEAEILQLAAVNEATLMSSSLDQTVSVWNISDGKFKFHMKGPAEPVHCLAVYNSELITGTTANRIGVHTSIDGQASFSSTKLRSDAFKGMLTSVTVVPLNKLLLLGADNGTITLLC